MTACRTSFSRLPFEPLTVFSKIGFRPTRIASSSSDAMNPPGSHLGNAAEFAIIFIDIQVDQHDPVLAERFSFTDDVLIHFANTAAIYENIVAGDTFTQFEFAIGKLKDLSVLHDTDILTGNADIFRQFGVLFQHPQFAMDGDQVLRADQVQKEFELFLAGVPGNMHRGNVLIDDIRAASEQLINGPIDGLFITRNGV